MGALDDQEFFVVEGCGWRGRRESRLPSDLPSTSLSDCDALRMSCGHHTVIKQRPKQQQQQQRRRRRRIGEAPELPGPSAASRRVHSRWAVDAEEVAGVEIVLLWAVPNVAAALGPAVTGIAWSNSVKKRQAVAGSGWEAAAAVGGSAVEGRPSSQIQFIDRVTVYEMACFRRLPLLCTETGSTLSRSSMSWERGCSMEACGRISHIFCVHALFAWNLNLISSSPLFWQPLAPCVATVHGSFWANFVYFLREKVDPDLLAVHTEEVVKMWQGSGRVRKASRRVAGQCVKGAIGVERQGKICPSLLKGKGMGKRILQLGHLVENRHLLQEMCRPQHVGHKSCLLEFRLEAGVGSPPTPESPPSPPSEELVKAEVSVLTPEDFSKYEKKLVPPKQQERVKLRERELLEAFERQANYEKQEQKHLEMIAKHEHNQQKAMLESVRTQLAEVRETVGALRAFVSETREPPNNPVVPPLPLPREPPPMDNGGILPTLGSAQDFLPN